MKITNALKQLVFHLRRKIYEIFYFKKKVLFENILLIAHAAGGVNSFKYTNSLEAFIENYDKGFRCFEIDLVLSADGKVVARHDWVNTFQQKKTNQEFPLSYKEFMKSKIYGRYTPIDLKVLIQLLQKYEDVFIIIDGKINNREETAGLYSQILQEFGTVDNSFKKRLYPQIFYQSDLLEINKQDFGGIVYVIGREKLSTDEIIEFCKINEIRIVSIPEKKINVNLVQQYLKSNICVFAYTINSVSKASSFQKIGVRGLFTDNVELVEDLTVKHDLYV